jgi:hypothetical protein
MPIDTHVSDSYDVKQPEPEKEKPAEIVTSECPRELSRRYTQKSVEALASIIDDPLSSRKDIISAANALLDRAHGKAHQSHEVKSAMTINVVCPIPATPNSVAIEKSGLVIDHEQT